MDMKLNHRLIKELRLKHSWSQEKLAEVTNLNPRTIQRVEADGTGSLQTRLRLAKAFAIEPGELDCVEPEAERQPVAASPIHLPLLLLITCIYLAWTPIYFSLSRSSFSSHLDFELFFRGSSLWFVLLVGVWLTLSALWLAVVFFRNRTKLVLHACYVLTPLLFGVLRIWQPDLVRVLLTLIVYASGLALLAAQYLPRYQDSRIQTVLTVALVNHIFLWCFHATLYSFAFAAFYRFQAGLDIPAPWISPGRFLMRTLSNVSYLLPVILVLLFSMGSGSKSTDTPAQEGRMRVRAKAFLRKFSDAATLNPEHH